MFLTTLLGAVVGGVLGFIRLIGPLVNGVVVAPALLAAVVGSAHAVRNDDGAFDGAGPVASRSVTRRLFQVEQGGGVLETLAVDRER
ncbi:MAG: hypothetical protein V5A38_13000 [Halolamina sp.]|uniref:hypothetical protein n=1 Tax=Halolamina sp. TaxID=1940283 RepID=UPI002FC3BCE0